MEVVAALRLDVGRRLADETQDHRDVVRREGPEDVLLATNLPEVEPVRVDVLDSSQLAAVEQVFQGQDRGMVPEEVADHQDALFALGQVDQLPALLRGQAERFFDEDVLSGQEGALREIAMGHGRRGNGDRGDVRVVEDGVDGVREGHGRVLGGDLGAAFGVEFDDLMEGAEFVEIADEIGAPGAGADAGDSGKSHARGGLMRTRE